MSTLPIATQIEARERQLEQLTRRFLAASEQLLSTLNASDKPVIEQQMQNLSREMEQVEAELAALKRGDLPHEEIRRQPSEPLFHEIDFVKPWRDFRTIFEDYVDLPEGGGALLLLPDFQTMCADLFIRRLRTWLDDKRYGSVVQHPIRLLPLEPLDGMQLLRKLGSYLNVELPASEAAAMATTGQKIRETLLASLDPQQILMLEIIVMPELYQAESFVRWFLDEFWTPLLAELQVAAAERPYLRCIALVGVDFPLPVQPPLAERYCAADEYCGSSPHQFAHLPLAPWAVEDIDRWLRRHSGLHFANAEQVGQHATQIHALSRNGEPLRVLDNLRRLIEAR